MDGIERYNIIYTETAIEDIGGKADYITYQLRDPDLAETWYLRLCDDIQRNLSTFPFKYPQYDVEPWNQRGIRLLVTRNDVVLYSIDERKQRVIIRAICTRGRDLSAHLGESY